MIPVFTPALLPYLFAAGSSIASGTASIVSNAITRHRQDNAIQRQMADLQAAGMNPLMAGQLGGSSSGGTSAPVFDDPYAKAQESRLARLQIDSARLTNEQLRGQIDAQEIANKKAQKELDYILTNGWRPESSIGKQVYDILRMVREITGSPISDLINGPTDGESLDPGFDFPLPTPSPKPAPGSTGVYVPGGVNSKTDIDRIVSQSSNPDLQKSLYTGSDPDGNDYASLYLLSPLKSRRYPDLGRRPVRVGNIQMIPDGTDDVKLFINGQYIKTVKYQSQNQMAKLLSEYGVKRPNWFERFTSTLD